MSIEATDLRNVVDECAKNMEAASLRPEHIGLFLFVGGKNDGRRIRVPMLPVIMLIIPQEKQNPWIPEDREEYRLERLVTEHGLFPFYVSASLTLEMALLRLIEHYTPNPDQNSQYERRIY